MAELTPVMKKFILHWGEMGSTWGLNRTVAQIHAMLYLSSTPLTAEDISESLELARSTVSTGLHELQSWGVVRVVHQLGNRRDHFEAIADIWEMFRIILRERKRREIDPVLQILCESINRLHDEGDDSYVEARLNEMLEVFEAINAVYNQFEQLPTSSLRRAARMSENFSRVFNLVNLAENKASSSE